MLWPLAQTKFYRVALALKRLDTPDLDYFNLNQVCFYTMRVNVLLTASLQRVACIVVFALHCAINRNQLSELILSQFFMMYLPTIDIKYYSIYYVCKYITHSYLKWGIFRDIVLDLPFRNLYTRWIFSAKMSVLVYVI